MIFLNRKALAFVAALLASGAVSAGLAAQDRTEMRVSLPFSASSIDPNEGGWLMHGVGVAELLMRFEEDGQFHPWLLESLESVDDLTWRMRLRPDVTFQNGKPVDAEAVVAAITYQLEHSPAARAEIPEGARFTVTDPLEILFETEGPFGSLPGVLAHRLMFPIFDAEGLDAALAEGGDLIGAGIYTGPYAVDSLDSQALTAVRYDDYWQGVPAMEALRVTFVPNINASILAVENGELDVAFWMPGVVRNLVEVTPGIHYITTTGTDSYLAYLNVTRPPFDDVDVRRAFMLGLDYESLANEALDGTARPATSFYLPLFPFAVHNQHTDRAEAARLLDAAGWQPGPNGIRVKDGQPLQIDVIYNSAIGDLVPLSGGVQFQLRDLGFDLRMVPVEDGYAGYTQYEWNAGFNSDATWGSGLPESFLNRYLTPAGDRNFTGYENAEISEIAATLPSIVDPEERNALLARAQEILIEEDPAIFLLAFYDQGAVVSDAYSEFDMGFALAFIDWQSGPNR